MSSELDQSADHTLDVRDIDGEPFREIMEALDGLGRDETLVLINNFEPEPLYDVLEEQGFTYESAQVNSDEWHVRIQST